MSTLPRVVSGGDSTGDLGRDASDLPPHGVAPSPESAARLAWMALWTAFAIFAVVATALVLGVSRYVERSLSINPGTLEIIGGTVLLSSEESSRETGREEE